MMFILSIEVNERAKSGRDVPRGSEMEVHT
jgi:hypothetical protein